jgi:hypothetical protein
MLQCLFTYANRELTNEMTFQKRYELICGVDFHESFNSLTTRVV